MEPWREEMRHYEALEARRRRYPTCVCCQEPIRTEYYLDLSAFGLAGYACEACVEENTGYTENLKEGD